MPALRHGMKGTKVYRCWTLLRNRCNNPKGGDYAYYGGRGIRCCARWDVFENFLADMGEPPTPLHTIERRDTDGDYEPGNCYWATRAQQSRNRSYCRITPDMYPLIRLMHRCGMTQKQIADRYGVTQVRISQVTREA